MIYDRRFGLPQSSVDYLNQPLPDISGIFGALPQAPVVQPIEEITESLTPTGLTPEQLALLYPQYNLGGGGNDRDFINDINKTEDEEDIERTTQTGGIADLIKTGLGFLVPGAGLLLGGGIQDLNQRFRNTMFGQSATGAEFFQNLRDKKAREEAARRGEIKELQARIDRGDFSGDITSPAAKAAANREARRGGQYDRDTGGGGGGGFGGASPGSQGPGGSDEMGSF